jgi:hypothetical protein
MFDLSKVLPPPRYVCPACGAWAGRRGDPPAPMAPHQHQEHTARMRDGDPEIWSPCPGAGQMPVLNR